jgi:membrane associated rhomboid family serine protease
MFPLHDDNPTEIFPLITLFIIAACIGVWGYIQGAGFSEQALGGSICDLGAIPAEVTQQLTAQTGPCVLGGLTRGALVTSMFLQLTGTIAALAHVATDPTSVVPMVGASGARLMQVAGSIVASSGGGGVAYGAHLGGFIAAPCSFFCFETPSWSPRNSTGW